LLKAVMNKSIYTCVDSDDASSDQVKVIIIYFVTITLYGVTVNDVDKFYHSFRQSVLS
jgi:hypothetical protein